MGDIGMIKGGACLEAPLKGKKVRRQRSRSQGHQQWSRGLPERRGGRNSKYKANICNTKHDKAIRRARGVLTQCYTIPAKGETYGKVFPKFGIFGQMKRRGTVEGSLC